MACREALALVSGLYEWNLQLVTNCAASIKHLREQYKGASSTIIEDIELVLKVFDEV